MKLTDILRTLCMDDEIMLDNFKEKTQIMKVRNLTWDKIRHFDKTVIRIRPCERNGKQFLYVAVDAGVM